jgi:hypothetical protein
VGQASRLSEHQASRLSEHRASRLSNSQAPRPSDSQRRTRKKKRPALFGRRPFSSGKAGALFRRDLSYTAREEPGGSELMSSRAGDWSFDPAGTLPRTFTWA